MATIRLPTDFKDFLRLLNSEKAEYLLVGGYSVGYHGYPRATGDMDVWVSKDPANAQRLVRAFRNFGFSAQSTSPELFLGERTCIQMGVPPLRIDVLTSVSGVDFQRCFSRREEATIDGVPVHVIRLDDLKENKKASGRTKAINDLENLP